MPRMDPMLGVPVMTNAEFWAAEGEREGKSGAEVERDFWTEWEQEKERERRALHDPTFALELLKAGARYCGKYTQGGVPAPRKVLAVIDVEYSESMRSSRTKVVALCERGHGSETVIDIATYEAWHDGGSYWDPPEGDTVVTWGGLH